MFAILAQQAQEPVKGNVFDIIPSVFSRMDALAHPEEVVYQLQALGVMWAMVFLICGLLVMLNGYKFYKIATVIIALLIGLFSGYRFGESIPGANGYIVGGCMALLLVVCCFPLMKYAVALIGGLTGAFVGANLWTAVASVSSSPQAAQIAKHHWIGALMGLIVCGMLAFILWKLAIVMFTSVSGATIAAIGGIALLLSFRQTAPAVSDSLRGHAITIPLLVFVPALIALIIQETQPDSDNSANSAER